MIYLRGKNTDRILDSDGRFTIMADGLVQRMGHRGHQGMGAPAGGPVLSKDT
jgi:hypothetical protein